MMKSFWMSASNAYTKYANIFIAILGLVAAFSIVTVLISLAFKIFVKNPYEVGLRTFS